MVPKKKGKSKLDSKYEREKSSLVWTHYRSIY